MEIVRLDLKKCNLYEDSAQNTKLNIIMIKACNIKLNVERKKKSRDMRGVNLDCHIKFLNALHIFILTS